MASNEQRIEEFVSYVGTLRGDEKGEAQVFCDRLFRAFGHAGYKEAGAILEERVAIKDGAGKTRSTKFADLVWKPRLLLEMKKRGENLHKHLLQAFEYWQRLVPHRPRYVVLCNFDEFWIYDFDLQLDEPIDRVALAEMPRRATAFNFLLPEKRESVFRNNRVDVSRAAADKVARVFQSLKDNYKAEHEAAQRFVLQCVVAMFSEDVGLLPSGLFSQLIQECRRDRAQSHDLFSGLFRQMNDPCPALGGRFQGVPYFNGGLFERAVAFDLKTDHITFLEQAAQEDWSRVQPAIFGTLFQRSMNTKARHALGAHFTSEIDIQKVVLPTIVRPWRERIEQAEGFGPLLRLHEEMRRFHVLDPSCGSGNFLYVAFRELKRLETELLQKLLFCDGARARQVLAGVPLVSTRQFFGLDVDAFAVELAKVTLMLAKEVSAQELSARLRSGEVELPGEIEPSLPLDNLDANIVCNDALFCAWPRADAIIGNPPYQSKNNMQREYGPAYVHKVRERYPQVPGRADYCVYWFRRAHDELAQGGRAGLVGTNTIRQNYSREGGLDYIVSHGGTITEAVGTQVWSGEAAAHVSIVNWVRGEQSGPKVLWTQEGDNVKSPVRRDELAVIPSSLSVGTDVTSAQRLKTNINSQACYQGQTHGHEGFLLSPEEAEKMKRARRENAQVLFPYLIAEDLLGRPDSAPSRVVIDFHPRDVLASGRFKEPFAHVQKQVLPARELAAKAEEERNRALKETGGKAKGNQHHRNFLSKWWLLAYPRADLIERIQSLPRYIVCGQVTKRPIFQFISSDIRPNAALLVFPLADDYSFGVLQSSAHWLWFRERCSTMKGDFRYTSDSVWDTFVWPQSPSLAQAQKVAQASRELRALRRGVMERDGLSLREIGRTLDLPGKNPLKDAQAKLDAAVRAAYGMASDEDALSFLLALNAQAHAREQEGEPVVAPGLPPCVRDAAPFLSDDCVRMP
jgi:SAM-dependent methyltransferase